MTEIWKDIIGYEGLYQVAYSGKIRSLDRLVLNTVNKKRAYKGIILLPTINKGGYYTVALSKVGIIKRVSIHRVVAIHFLPNPLNLPEVNHKLGIKSLNSADDVEWCSEAYNKQHAISMGLNDNLLKYIESKKIRVIQQDLQCNNIQEFESITKASNILNINRGAIYNCCIGKQLTANNYKFIFKVAE